MAAIFAWRIDIFSKSCAAQAELWGEDRGNRAQKKEGGFGTHPLCVTAAGIPAVLKRQLRSSRFCSVDGEASRNLVADSGVLVAHIVHPVRGAQLSKLNVVAP